MRRAWSIVPVLLVVSAFVPTSKIGGVEADLTDSTLSADLRSTPRVNDFYSSRNGVRCRLVTLLYHDVAVTEVNPLKTVAWQGSPIQVNVTLENQGNFTEAFNVTLTASRPEPRVVSFELFGSALGGWGFTPGSIMTPGPALMVNLGDLVNLTLTSADDVQHNFFVDYSGNGIPCCGEPVSPDFGGTAPTTVSFQFIADNAGTCSYYCQYETLVMCGSFIVNPRFVNTTLVGKGRLTLASGESTTTLFSWNTSGFGYGDYTLTAETIVPEDLDSEDNSASEGGIYVTILGDLTGDFAVDIFDAVLVALAFGASPTSPNWNPNADATGDSIVDIFDMVIVALHFGDVW